MSRRIVVLSAVSLLALGIGVATSSAKLVYRTRGFHGLTKAPKRTAAKPHAVIVGLGKFPHLLVDEAGYGHLVWNEPRQDGPDILHYCRLPRGGRACDVSTRLRPPGGGSEDDLVGPQVLQIGSELIVRTTRYGCCIKHPNGVTGFQTTWEWISEDGGRSFTGPADVSDAEAADAVVFDRANPAISTISSSTGLVNTSLSGRYQPGGAALGAPNRTSYSGSLAVVGDKPVAAFADIDGTTFIRRWTGVGNANDQSTWSAPLVLRNADEPRLSTGPLGTYLMYRPRTPDRAYRVRRVDLVHGRFGPPSRVDPSSEVNYRAFGEDRGGMLRAAWAHVGRGTLELQTRTSRNGRTWSAAETLASVRPDSNHGGQTTPTVAAASDGGGFAAWQDVVYKDSGPIAVSAVGTLAKAPGKGAGEFPPLGGVTPPGGYEPGISFTCQKITFQAVAAQAQEGCFRRDPRDPQGSAGVTNGPIRLNGLEIVPDADARIVIDPRLRHIETIGQVSVQLRGAGDPITLFHGELHVDLPSGASGAKLFSFDTGKFAAALKGFPIDGSIDVFLEKDSVRIPVALRLPEALADVHGEATLRADNARGLHLDSLHIHIGNVFVGPLLVDYFDLDYTSGDTWRAAGQVTVPAGGKLAASAQFINGNFKHGAISFVPPPPGIVIGPLVYLTKIGGEFDLDPTHIAAEARIGAGAAVNGVSPFSLDGRLDLTFPSPPKPVELKASGQGKLLLVPLFDAFVRVEGDGYADFGGHAALAVPILSLSGNVDGFVDGTTGNYGASARVALCIDVSIGPVSFPCIKGDLAFSNAGLAVCASALGTSAGVELPWKAVSPAVLVSPPLLAYTLATHLEVPCSTGAYRIPPRAASAAATGDRGYPISLPGGLPTATVLLIGDSGPPSVTVTAPGGGPASAGSAAFVTARAANATYVVLKKPRAGTWTIHRAAGSPQVVKVLQAAGYRPATVRARIGGRGRRRSITYRVTHLGGGQAISFLEHGRFGTRVIGRTTKTRGSLRFTSAPGRGGRRTILARVQRAGLVTRTSKIGAYRAPAPLLPGRPGHVRLRRRGATVSASWGRAARAVRYAVRITDSHGRAIVRILRTRRTKVRGIPTDARVTISIRGLTARNAPGRPRTATKRAARRSIAVYSRH